MSHSSRGQGPSRRSVLATLVALPVASAPACHPESRPQPSRTTEGDTTAPDRPPEPGAWVPDEPLDEATFPFGVAAGDATDSAVILSVRTSAPSVALRAVVGVDDTGWEPAADEAGLPVVEGTASVELTGLAPDTVYRYVFVAPDGGRSRVGRFRTAPAPGSRRRKLVIGATSCLGGDNPTFPGLANAARQELDAMLLLGDTVYADGAVTLADYRAVWDEQLIVPSLQELLASTSVIATWDDHEVANNWTLGEGSSLSDHVEPEQVTAGDQAFREAIPQRLEGGVRWRSLVWGDLLEVLVLDSRGERTTDRIVSPEQLDWATARIAESAARFVLVLVSVHITDHYALMLNVQAEDRWQGYPAQRGPLVEAAAGSRVLFITGDMHYGAIQRVDPEGGPGADVWEIAAGPSGSRLFPIQEILDLQQVAPAQYDQVVQGWTWTRLELDPVEGEILVQLLDDGDAVVAERRIAL
ncbi:MAG: alkaline phosphatase D family protein [Myxococcota bacterium]